MVGCCPGDGCQCLGDSVHVVARMYITGVLLLGLPVAVLAICMGRWLCQHWGILQCVS